MKKAFLFLYACTLILTLSNCSKPAAPQLCIDDAENEQYSLQALLSITGNKHPRIYGLGLTYQAHVDETTGWGKPKNIPVFLKDVSPSFGETQQIIIPTQEDLRRKLIAREPELTDHESLTYPVLLDYEIEMGVLLLETPDWNRLSEPGYRLPVGYFLVNDLSVRNMALLGEGRSEGDKYKYWGDSKGFPGFLPVGSTVVIPNEQSLDEILCVSLTLTKNDHVVQSETTDNLLFSLRGMLQQIRVAHDTRNYPELLPKKGDIILTGTPGGVAIGATSKLGRVVASIFRFGRHKRLRKVVDMAERQQRDNSPQSFLEAGDILIMDGGVLGNVRLEFVSP